MRRLSAFVAIALIALVVAYLANNRAESPSKKTTEKREANILRLPANAPQLAYLRISEVKEDIIPALEPLHGRVTYNDDVTARITSPIAGRVIDIRAHLGDRVKAGQTLVALDAPDFSQALADQHKAQSDLQLKSKAFEREKLLYEGGVVAAKDYESAEDDLNQARAESIRAISRLHNLGVDRNGSFDLHTHIAGIVTERHVNVGSEIAPDNNAPLFVVTDPAQLWLDLDVAEKDLNQITLGQHFRVQSDAYPDTEFEATSVFVGKVMDPQTRRVTVHCIVRDASERLKPEMYVRATPLGGNILRPRVPNTSLISEGLKTYLFTEEAPGVLQKREVTLAYRGHDESYIENGLHTGEHVVISGVLLLNAEMQGD